MRSFTAAFGDRAGEDAEIAAAAAGPLLLLSCAAKLSMFCSALRTSSVMSCNKAHTNTLKPNLVSSVCFLQ